MAPNSAEQTGTIKIKRVARILGEPQAAAHTYHVLSRVIEGRGIFDRAGKEKFRQLLEAYSEMTGIEVFSWCCMSDHFHIRLQVPNAEEGRSKLDDEEILRRLSLVAQPERVDEVRQTLGRLKDEQVESGYLEYRERLLARMYDLSAFMGGLRQRLSQWYNQRVGRKGPLWEDRFKNVLLEDAANGVTSQMHCESKWADCETGRMPVDRQDAGITMGRKVIVKTCRL